MGGRGWEAGTPGNVTFKRAKKVGYKSNTNSIIITTSFLTHSRSIIMIGQ